MILGQSLGTAVAAAVGLRLADATNELLPPTVGDAETQPLLNSHDSGGIEVPTTFAGIILVAPFSSLPSLMLTYRIGGYLPILLPLRPFPPLARALTGRMVDQWPTADRLAAYYTALVGNPKLLQASDCAEGRRAMGSLQIIHAVNDGDIDYHQTEMICSRMLGQDEKCISKAGTLDVRKEGRPRVRFEILEYGGAYASSLDYVSSY